MIIKPKIMRNILIVLLFLGMLLNSCARASSNDEMAVPGYEGFENDGVIEQTEPQKIIATNKSETQNRVSDQDIEKKIIKTADISIEVKDFKKARILLDKLLKKHKAYFSNERQNNTDYEISTSITIRLKSENFDSLLNEVGNLAYKVNNKEVHVTDVTEEFIDVMARLKNKKQVEQQYLELLKRANTIDEILKVNEHLRILREEIESKEGRLKYLENQVTYSTINLYMYQTNEQAYSGFGEKIIKGLEGGWKGILAFIIGLAYIWPLVLLIVFFIWLILRWKKKKKQNPTN